MNNQLEIIISGWSLKLGMKLKPSASLIYYVENGEKTMRDTNDLLKHSIVLT